MATWKRVALAFAGLVVLWFGLLLYVGSPAGGEVVTVTTTDADGSHETPLWIVDRDGQPWLRAGNSGSRWVARVRANPRIEVQRGSTTTPYRATPVPEATPEIDALMRTKYGFSDQLVGWLNPGSRASTLALRLDPDSP